MHSSAELAEDYWPLTGRKPQTCLCRDIPSTQILALLGHLEQLHKHALCTHECSHHTWLRMLLAR